MIRHIQTPRYSQHGSALIALFTMLAIFAIIGAFFVSTYVNAKNTSVAFEEQIKSAYEEGQNVLSQGSLKVREVAKVTDRYSDKFDEVYTNMITARYGEGGSDAMLQMLTESNPQLDSAMYAKIQQQIQSTRDKFENSQRRLIELKRAYSQNINYAWIGMWISIAGYPKINLDDYQIIKSEHSNETYKTGVDAGLDF